MLIKNNIPDVATLHNRLESVLESGLTEFLEHTKDRRSKVYANVKFVLVSVFFFVAIWVFISVFLLSIGTGMTFQIAVALSIIWAAILLVSSRSWLRNTRLLAREVNMALTPTFSAVFDRLFLYTHNGEKAKRVKQLLTESSLLTTEGLWVTADDSFEVFSGEQKTEFHEVLVSMREPKGGTGRDAVETEIFRGMLMVTKLGIQHQAETYISTDGDRHGFAHQSFWTVVLGMSKVKTTELEWNDFEQVLHVASTDGRAAREFLSPEVMQDVYEWWQEHKLNMRIAIKHDRLYLLLPEAKTRIEASTASAKLSEIVKYAKTLARPIWRGLVLADDVA